MVKIGDGTAPPGWPAYGAVLVKSDLGDKKMVQCRFDGCGHLGELGSPAHMHCMGLNCECSCCRFLSGAKVHGLTYG